ncbi:MAG TPA: sugar phosphate isomerase/epimerase family protein [Tepidisphaeraceae bacterium]|nr:sugar phosphate isomerase/epimerase family protein [Tepidisphaeraceae bacterium]
MTNHSDIRIGTLIPHDNAANYIRQVLPHGFESFQLFIWEKIAAGVDLKKVAPEVLAACGDKAVVSSLGMFGNPMQNEQTLGDWRKCIDNARAFNCDLVCGFAGALDDKSVPDSMPRYKEVWSDLVKRAEDNGVRIAFENCDMGGTWQAAKYNIAHAPTAWELMWDAVPSKAVGIEWEPCHQMGSFVEPIPQLRKLVASGKLFHVHGKDATVARDVIREFGTRGGKPWIWHRHPGFGDTNWTDVISILRQHNYKGFIDIEGWHDPVYKGELEMTGQVHALNYLKRCRGGAFVPSPK